MAAVPIWRQWVIVAVGVLASPLIVRSGLGFRLVAPWPVMVAPEAGGPVLGRRVGAAPRVGDGTGHFDSGAGWQGGH